MPQSVSIRTIALAAGCTLVAAASASAGSASARLGVQPEVARHEARRADLDAARARAAVAPDLDPAALRAAFATDRKALPLDSGDLVTSVGSASAAMRIVLRPRSARIRKDALPAAFVSRGIDHDPLSGRIAIAAVSRVLVYDPDSGEVTVLDTDGQDDPFGFVNDVLFDERGLLVIADQGADPSGKEPADGRIWEYEPDSGSMRRLAGRRRLSNPGLLALDSRGRVLVVDLEAGRRFSPLLELRWDTVLLLKGVKRKGARPIFKGDGLQATAFDVGPDDRMWFGSLAELVVIEGKSLSMPCPVLELPFEFVTGLVVVDETTALLSDGADTVTGRRFIHEVDDACESSVRAKGKRIDGVRGLARVLEAAEESAS